MKINCCESCGAGRELNRTYCSYCKVPYYGETTTEAVTFSTACGYIIGWSDPRNLYGKNAST